MHSLPDSYSRKHGTVDYDVIFVLNGYIMGSDEFGLAVKPGSDHDLLPDGWYFHIDTIEEYAEGVGPYDQFRDACVSAEMRIEEGMRDKALDLVYKAVSAAADAGCSQENITAKFWGALNDATEPKVYDPSGSTP